MLIAIASRAARGHSGRPLGTSWWTRLSYLLVLGGALWRVAAPPGLIAVAGELWSLGWLVFVIEHAPMLIMARLDGRPG